MIIIHIPYYRISSHISQFKTSHPWPPGSPALHGQTLDGPVGADAVHRQALARHGAQKMDGHLQMDDVIPWLS